MSGILFKTLFNSVLLAKPLTLVFVAKPPISGILSSAVFIFPSISVILLLKVLVCNNPLTSGIFNFKLPTLVSHSVFKTYFIVSIP